MLKKLIEGALVLAAATAATMPASADSGKSVQVIVP